MVILHRIKEVTENGKKVYKVQQSTFPFLWSTLHSHKSKEKAEKQRDMLNRMSSMIA